jgi:hypothetical protein
VAKRRSRGKRSGTEHPQPPVLYPLVVRMPTRPRDPGDSQADADAWMGYNPDMLSQADIDRLEAAAGIVFKPEVRRRLQGIAADWISHDLLLQSPRPREFRARLQRMGRAVKRAIDELDLNPANGPILDYHLLHWLMDAKFDGAQEMLRASASFIGPAQTLLDSLVRVEQNLPIDTGRRRPMDEDRFIIALADQFEASGVHARAYTSDHSESGYGETPFRQFVHEFYKVLPISSRRTQTGLDEAIRRALNQRRHAKKG